jgi:membrane fusion protein (multidrug efflux system)
MAEPPSTTEPAPVLSAPASLPPAKRPRRWLWPVILLVLAVGGGFLAYPRILLALSTVSTDDAYVNAHVTFVAPRISETVTKVYFDNNDHVNKGDLLVELDEAMARVRLGQAEAALGVAAKEAMAQLATGRGLAAQAKVNRFKLASAITSVRTQIADLRAEIAQLREQEASEELARKEAERYNRLAETKAVTQEQADVRQTDYTRARQSRIATEEQIRKIRSGLEVAEEPEKGKPLDDLPPNVEQVHSSVLAALGAFAYNLAELGLALPAFNESPDDFLKKIRALAPGGDLDALVEATVQNSPTVASAQARVRQAEQDVAMAKLNLSYCKIFADIDGFVSNRNVNVGDRVSQGQRLMAIRSADEIWVDCNFKETQLGDIRIGQPVDLRVDAYPGKVFAARVTGFNPGTGSSLALLPPQNATGNFVKIVQRLPVRVELVGPNPKDTPLFVGLSCVPMIKIHETPEGPNAGQRLRGNFPKVGDGGER